MLYYCKLIIESRSKIRGISPLFLMEELIEKADSANSAWGNLCFLAAFIGIGISGLVIAFSFTDPQLRGIRCRFWRSWGKYWYRGIRHQVVLQIIQKD